MGWVGRKEGGVLMRGNSFVEDPDDRVEQGGFPGCVAGAVSCLPNNMRELWGWC
jgi:hypothetical protein